jgi:2-methylcitrate dehydratase PrpD
MTHTERSLARHVAHVTPDAIPVEVMERAWLGLVDTLACMLAGTRSRECAKLIELLRLRGGARESSAVGVAERLPMPSAAFINGALAHWCEWDDLHDSGIIHASAGIWPTLLAVAEAREISGSGAAPEIMAAAVASYDVAGRISESLTPYSPNGWYATSVATAAAAAAGAGRLCGLSEDGILSVMGLAATASSLLRQPILDRVSGKNALCAQTASVATTALDLALSGVQGAPRFLEGEFGLGPMLAGRQVDFRAALADLGSRFSVNEISLKPYPCCRAVHPSIDLALQLRAVVDADAVKRVKVSVCQPMFEVVGRPFVSGPNPRMAALFSIPYTVAAALVHGRVDLGTFEPDAIAADAKVRSLAERIVVTAYPIPTGITMYQVPVTMTCVDQNGGEVERSTIEVRGSPRKPLSRDEFDIKLHACCSGVLPPDLAEEFRQCVGTMNRWGLSAITALLRSANVGNVAAGGMLRAVR